MAFVALFSFRQHTIVKSKKLILLKIIVIYFIREYYIFSNITRLL